jgi:hypothetical protein
MITINLVSNPNPTSGKDMAQEDLCRMVETGIGQSYCPVLKVER